LPLLVSAAAANHPIAEYELAEFYETGQLVPKDMTVARRLYTAAASHGMKEAQARLDQLGPP
jgi:TPR repeat protein